MNANKNDEDSTREIQIKMILKGISVEMFEWLKEFYNLGYNAEVVRLLIKSVYDSLKGKAT